MPWEWTTDWRVRVPELQAQGATIHACDEYDYAHPDLTGAYWPDHRDAWPKQYAKPAAARIYWEPAQQDATQ